MIKKMIFTQQYKAAKANGLLAKLKSFSHKNKVPYEIALACASRETGIKNILGDGDHGVGVIQIDVRFHPIAKRMGSPRFGGDNTYLTNPDPLIDYGYALLRSNYEWAKQRYPREKYSWAGDFSWWKIALAAYNAGRGGASQGVELGNVDARTAGGNYGLDSMQRSSIFAEIIHDQEASI